MPSTAVATRHPLDLLHAAGLGDVADALTLGSPLRDFAEARRRTAAALRADPDLTAAVRRLMVDNRRAAAMFRALARNMPSLMPQMLTEAVVAVRPDPVVPAGSLDRTEYIPVLCGMHAPRWLRGRGWMVAVLATVAMGLNGWMYGLPAVVALLEPPPPPVARAVMLDIEPEPPRLTVTLEL
jgi:hypothetical protein